MSSKFSDVPYFIVEAFLNNLTSYTDIASSPPYSAYLRGVHSYGAGTNITAKGGYGVNLYVKNITPSSTELGYNPYYMIKSRNYELTSRDSTTGFLENTTFTFNFESADVARNGSEITYQQLLDYSSITDNTPVEVYFGDDKLIHDFVDANSEYEGYVNTNKRYLYFGQLYAIGDNTFVIDFNQMFKYAIKALPVNDRTNNLQIFLEVFFDQLYSKIYNSLKNILCQSDPYEMDSRYLYYLMQMFNVNANVNMQVDTQRAFIANIPYYLKRKGAYASLYIIWNMLVENTSNLLNVYERWHNWDLTDVPLGNFTDYLYTSNNVYNSSPPNTGAGISYYSSSTSSIVVDITTPSTTWVVAHGLNNQYPLSQYIDNDGNLILPLEVSYDDANQITATFGEAVYGRAVCSIVPTDAMDTVLVVNTPSATWNFNHGLNEKYPIIYAISNNKEIIPDDIQYVDDLNATLTFSSAVDGVVVATTDTDLLVSSQSSNTTWTVTHNFNNSYPLVQIVDSTDYNMYPSGITFTDSNTLTVTFSEATAGKAIVFSNTEVNYPTHSLEVSGGCLSPHYRVEIDLSNEPLLPTAIINEAIWNDLLTYWEETRPVCKYAHYSEVISPVVDFSGNSISLYAMPNKYGYLYSICCSPTTSFETDTMGYSSSNFQSVWIIKHTFNTVDLMVQCFDKDKNQIQPASIEFATNDTIIITFSSATNGFALISKPMVDFSLHQTSSSALWETTYNFGVDYKYLLSLVKYSDQRVFVPKYITAAAVDSHQVTLTTADTGTATFDIHSMGADWYTRSGTPGTEWIVYHGLDSTNVMVQAYNTSDQVIYPKAISVTNNNVVTITFDTAQAGYAVVKKIGTTGTNMTDLMASVSTIKIGTGGSGSWNARIENGLETLDASFNTTVEKEDADYYYLKTTIDDGLEHNITEMGVFDGSDNILFYSYMVPLYKPANVSLIIWYRIEKSS